jgi:ATP-dependent Clp protease protease subunit
MAKKNADLDLLFEYGIDEKSRTITLIGEVDDDMLHVVECGLTHLERLNNESITIRLNSGGGSVTSGLSIIDRIQESTCEINIHASGQICSMAILILAAGDFRTANNLTQFMHHEETYDSPGRHSQNKGFIAFSDKFDDMLCKWLATRTTKDFKFWKSTGVGIDHWFTSVDAKNYGLIHEIITGSNK